MKCALWHICWLKYSGWKWQMQAISDYKFFTNPLYNLGKSNVFSLIFPCLRCFSQKDSYFPSTALLPATLEGPKPKGSNSSMLRSMKSSGVFAIMTFSSGPPNSNNA